MSGSTTNWSDLSEICFGLILEGRLDINKFSAEMFANEYEEGFKDWHRNRSKTKLTKTIGGAIEIAIQAAQAISDESCSEIAWHELLRHSQLSYALGVKTERISKKLKSGQQVSVDEAIETAAGFKDLAHPESIGLTNAKDVDITDFVPTELSGYKPIDENLGGIVVSGNILVMGTTGVGKSLFSQQFWGHWLAQYPDRKVAIWSLEMTTQQYLYRGIKLYPKFAKAVREGRVLVSDRTTNIDDVGIEAAATGVNAIVVDYADYLVEGDQTEAAMGKIYRQMNNISRSMNIPFMMLLQPNRSSYESGIPKMYHARYSGMAENVAAQFWVLFEPKKEEDTNGDFLYIEDSMYIVAWKQRFGWLDAHRGPGAVILPSCKNVWGSGDSQWLKWGAEVESHRKSKRRQE